MQRWPERRLGETRQNSTNTDATRAGIGVSAFELVEFTDDVAPLFAIGWWVLAFGDDRPKLDQFGIQRDKLGLSGRYIVLGKDCLHRAFRNTQ